MTLSTEQLEELGGLLEAATPGPWEAEFGDHTHRYAHIKDDDDRTIFYKYGAGPSKQADRDEADARLIVAAVNALPALIAAAANRSTAGFGAEGVDLDRYDAGLLNDYGGGNVDWWWDYIRAELERAHDHYQAQADAAPKAPTTPDPIGWTLRNTRTGRYSAGLFAREDNATERAARQTSDPDTWVVVPVFASPTTPDLAVKELEEAGGPITAVVHALEGAYGFEDDVRVDVRHFGPPDNFNPWPTLTWGDLRRLSRALAALGGDNQAEGVG
jgi:hypothetical protein